MKNIKKMALVLVLTLAMSMQTFATDIQPIQGNTDTPMIDIETEITRALKGETDLPTNQAHCTVNAFTVDQYGNKQGVDVDVYVTTRKLTQANDASAYAVNRPESATYATTAVAVLSSKDKSDSNITTMEYVTATMTLFWRDVFGIDNEFMGLSGSWTIATNPVTHKKATLSQRAVTLRGYGLTSNSYGSVHRIRPTTNLFEISDQEYADGYFGYEARSEVKINGTEWLVLEVSTGSVTVS